MRYGWQFTNVLSLNFANNTEQPARNLVRPDFYINFRDRTIRSPRLPSGQALPSA